MAQSNVSQAPVAPAQPQLSQVVWETQVQLTQQSQSIVHSFRLVSTPKLDPKHEFLFVQLDQPINTSLVLEHLEVNAMEEKFWAPKKVSQLQPVILAALWASFIRSTSEHPVTLRVNEIHVPEGGNLGSLTDLLVDRKENK